MMHSRLSQFRAWQPQNTMLNPLTTMGTSVARLRHVRLLLLTLAFSLLNVGCAVGYQGIVYQRLNDGAIGPTIAGAEIGFSSEDGGSFATISSGATGKYKISLSPARYRVTATHPNYQDYSSTPGFFVVSGNDGFQTGNIFLYEPTVTTVLLLRHADRDGSNDALKVPEGVDRAARFADVAGRAGVTAIYSTDTNRTRSTAQPLADLLNLNTEIYVDETQLTNTINADHAGDTVLVVGHSNTQKPIIEAFLNQNFYPNTPFVEDFDNLFVLAKPTDGSAGTVINLQYGADTGPDLGNLSRDDLTTVLLVRTAEAIGGALTTAGQNRAQDLVHLAGKAGLDEIYRPAGNVPALATVTPLANAVGVSLTDFDAANISNLAASLVADHSGDTIAVVADHDSLRPLLVSFGAKQFPATFANEHDHLIILFVLAVGDSRRISLEYGATSP